MGLAQKKRPPKHGWFDKINYQVCGPVADAFMNHTDMIARSKRACATRRRLLLMNKLCLSTMFVDRCCANEPMNINVKFQCLFG